MPKVNYNKYYSFEKGRYGGPCGSIFPFFRDIAGLSALGSDYVEYVPAGYLKCRGQILSADQYPNLARVLGVGNLCIYRKSGVTLAEPDASGKGGTFQLPDLGSKYITAAATAGTYSNTTTFNASTNSTVLRAGIEVSLEAQSDSVDFNYDGEFKLPGRTITVVGNVAANSPPSSTSDETLSIGQFLAHGHNSTMKISRKINYRTDGMNGSNWRKRNYYCTRSGSSGCNGDAEFGLAHKFVTLDEAGSSTGTKHRHYGTFPVKVSENKTASVSDMFLDAGPLVTTVTVNTANTFKMDEFAPKFILCEFLIKF
jgi:hypothetical protein